MSRAPAIAVSLPRVRAFRLGRQHLLEPAADPVAAVSAMLGAQAQVHSAGVLQLRARCPSVTGRAVREHLFTSRRLVKLWTQRSTLHIVAADDLPIFLGLHDLRAPARARWLEREGLTVDRQAHLAQAIADALSDGPLNRRQIADRVCPRLGDWARAWIEMSWGSVLKTVRPPGSLCHGPANATTGTFLRLDRWVDAKPLAVGEALRLLLDRYLAAYGPATEHDFAKFAGLPVAVARAAFEQAGKRVDRVDFAGRTAWVRAADADALRQAPSLDDHLIALPGFDPYVLAHADTEQFVAERHRKKVARQSGWISPVIVWNGEVVGVWFHEWRAGRLAIDVRPFGRWPPGLRRRARDAAAALLAGLEGEEGEPALEPDIRLEQI